jgi:hypothetical protein
MVPCRVAEWRKASWVGDLGRLKVLNGRGGFFLAWKGEQRRKKGGLIFDGGGCNYRRLGWLHLMSYVFSFFGQIVMDNWD